MPVDPYGTLADYTPFYFAARSPMLFAIQWGRCMVTEGLRSDRVLGVDSATFAAPRTSGTRNRPARRRPLRPVHCQ
ncbi:DarT ssDNA thymidine ADP-ribosyltransferase family protein [Nocardia farcinica]|uniref:DarT ssDNA thymidine ADP-ribosyltransferase family protein n=1 Tax=Nocardia farcinica TaxID=37329 RepID=UPI0036F417CD